MSAAIVPPGAPIAVVAPSGAYDPQRLESGLATARAHGLDVRPFPGMLAPHRYLASSDRQRLEQLVEALVSPAYAAVWIVRGGYGLGRLIERLPLDRVGDRPVIGFSDVTALFAALHPRGPLVHGPMPHSLPVTDASSTERLFRLLAGEAVPALHGEAWVPGEAEGRLVVGNLTMFATLCGTRFQPDWRGAIVVLEEVGEAPYRVDRLFTQLRQAGVLDGVAGLCFGEFDKCDPPPGSAWSTRDVLVDLVRDLGVPVLGDLPVGHGRRNAALVWGVRARIVKDRLETDSWSR